MVRIVLFLLVLFAPAVQYAQQPDSLSKKRGGAVLLLNDSLPKYAPPIAVLSDSTAPVVPKDTMVVVKKKRSVTGFFRNGYPNPRKAAICGLAFPGGGQIYNRDWWKLPLIYGGLGGGIYAINYNLKFYRLYRDNYYAKVNDLTLPNPEYSDVDATSLKSARNASRRYLEYTYLGIGLGYLLVTAEAYVDAHLGTFDVSDDLSLKIKPTAIPSSLTNSTWGIGLAFNFH